MRRASILLPVILPVFLAPAAFGWGCEGHQIVALIARAHLTPQVAAAVDRLLTQNPIDPALKRFCQDQPTDLMADAATWADDIKNTEKTGPWHYVDIPLQAKDQDSLEAWCPPIGPSVGGNDRPGCITNAIPYELAILRDTTRTAADRATALRYVIHFVGDIHQPLHDSDNDDRGGNCTALKFFGEDRPINLHAIWDYKLLEHNLGARATSETAYARAIDRRFAAQAKAWRSQKPDPEAWAWEGHALAVNTTYGELHPSIPMETPNPAADCKAERDKVSALNISIGEGYFDDTLPKIEEQLAKAGNRLASLLNQTL